MSRCAIFRSVAADTLTLACSMIELTQPCEGNCGDSSFHTGHLSESGLAQMSIWPAKFDSLPVTIEAMCWIGGASAATPVIDWVLSRGGTATWMEEHAVVDAETEEVKVIAEAITIRTLEGDMTASPEDWIIRGTEGEFYPCKPTVFERKYTPHKEII